jgi:hypothetical protein
MPPPIPIVPAFLVRSLLLALVSPIAAPAALRMDDQDHRHAGRNQPSKEPRAQLIPPNSSR